MGMTPPYANDALNDEFQLAGELALLITLPDVDGEGWAEPAAAAYARISVDAATWTVSTDRETTYPDATEWPDADEEEDAWGIVRAWGWIRDDVLRMWEPVAAPVQINPGDTGNGFAAGVLVVRA